MTVAAGVMDALRRVVGDEGVSVAADELAAVAHDMWPPALIRRRAGLAAPSPECVVRPRTQDEAAAVVRICHEARVPLLPFGAGTGVCGAATPERGGVVLSLRGLDRIAGWDLESGHVRAEPGIIGLRLEEACLERGWSLGHYPSSLPISTLGGFLATRSVGQLSTRYGRIDDRVAGLRVALTDGTVMELAAQPGSGVGPDLRRLFLGSEGGMGVILEATLRLHRAPEACVDAAYRVADFATGAGMARTMLQRGLRPALLRLYDPEDTALQVQHLGIDARDAGDGSLLLVSCEGCVRLAAAEAAEVDDICTAAGAVPLGPRPVQAWRRHRYDIGDLQERYLPLPGAVIDTIEVAAPWAQLLAVYTAVKETLRQQAITLCHLSHGYLDGACLYFTIAASAGDDDSALPLYRRLWDAAMAAVVANGGTIAHHHGAGRARAPYLASDLGEGGVEVLRRLKRAFDPHGIANPGNWGLGSLQEGT